MKQNERLKNKKSRSSGFDSVTSGFFTSVKYLCTCKIDFIRLKKDKSRLCIDTMQSNMKSI